MVASWLKVKIRQDRKVWGVKGIFISKRLDHKWQPLTYFATKAGKCLLHIILKVMAPHFWLVETWDGCYASTRSVLIIASFFPLSWRNVFKNDLAWRRRIFWRGCDKSNVCVHMCVRVSHSSWRAGMQPSHRTFRNILCGKTSSSPGTQTYDDNKGRRKKRNKKRRISDSMSVEALVCRASAVRSEKRTGGSPCPHVSTLQCLNRSNFLFNFHLFWYGLSFLCLKTFSLLPGYSCAWALSFLPFFRNVPQARFLLPQQRQFRDQRARGAIALIMTYILS